VTTTVRMELELLVDRMVVEYPRRVIGLAVLRERWRLGRSLYAPDRPVIIDSFDGSFDCRLAASPRRRLPRRKSTNLHRVPCG
jgi:hypothetical protein